MAADAPKPVKTMRLRYAGTCVGCDASVDAGTRAHYLPTPKVVRCLDCGPGEPAGAPTETPTHATVEQPAHRTPDDLWAAAAMGDMIIPPEAVLTERPLPRGSSCADCGRKLRRGQDALANDLLSKVLCLECVALDTVHSVGTPGAGARREHARRLQRHETKVRAAHPRLGGLVLALTEDPQHIRAWQTGAVGEEAFGHLLSGCSGPQLKVLHDRKIPGSRANIDHLAITSKTVWVLDSKRYKGKVERRGGGLLSTRPPSLTVGGRDQTKLVEGVRSQVETVRALLTAAALDLGLSSPPDVRGGLVFTNAEFGLFTTPFLVDEVWVGWGRAIRKRLREESTGPIPVHAVAKRLARELRAG